MVRLGAWGQRSPDAVSSSTTIALSPNPTPTAPGPDWACDGLKLATTSAIFGRSRSTWAAYVGLPMISSPSVRKQRFMASVPVAVGVARTAFRKATNGPLAPVAPRPRSTRG